MPDGKIIAPKTARAVDADGNFSREWIGLMTALVRAVNDLSERVKKLESQ